MKKWIIAAIALLLVGGAVAGSILLFGGDEYKRMQKRLSLPAKELVLQVTVGEDKERLTACYQVQSLNGRDSITYSYEEFASFILQDGVYVPPPERKNTVTGSMLVENGRVVELDGEAPSLPLELVTLSSLRFEEACFTNAVLTETTFEADVADPKTFLGLSEGVENMHLSLSFDEEHVRTMTLRYDSALGNPVILQFSFVY